MRAVLMQGVGPPSCMTIGTAPKPVLSDNYDVILKVAYTALNRADTLQRAGKYPPPPGASTILGLEAVGEVVESRSRWKVGEKVMALLDGGGYAEYVAARSTDCMVLPDLPLEDCACIPEAWLTAYQMLHFVARVQPTDKLLVLAGASGVGTAAIQLAAHAGLTHIVASSSEQKQAACKRFGATETVGRDYTDYKEAFDVVLDPVAGTKLSERLKSCNMDARYVLYAGMAGVKCELNTAVLLGKRIALLSTTLRSRSNEYKATLCEAFRDVIPSLGSTLHPVKDSVYAMEDVVAAHEKMERSENVGKIVLKVS